MGIEFCKIYPIILGDCPPPTGQLDRSQQTLLERNSSFLKVLELSKRAIERIGEIGVPPVHQQV